MKVIIGDIISMLVKLKKVKHPSDVMFLATKIKRILSLEFRCNIAKKFF